jgi:NADH-quinone oxidoreductase subunit C
MEGAQLAHRLQAAFGDQVVGAGPEALDPWVEVQPDALVRVGGYLKQQPDLQFDMLNCITVVDYLQTDPKKAAKVEWQPHLEIFYHLSSIPRKHRLVIKVQLPRWKDDRPGELPQLPSVAGVWKTAHWHEREVFDLCGVDFVGHPDLRRILCPEDWEGYPLRKDYEMPLEYHGMRGR